MADIGVLNLRIHDNSSEAVEGLNKLAGALERIKGAITDAQKLSTVANQIKRIATVINENVSNDTLTKLDQFSTALERLKGIGDIRVNITAANRITNTLRDIEAGRQSMEQMAPAAQQMSQAVSDGFAETQRDAREARMEYEAMQEAMSGNEGALDFSHFDVSELPFDALGQRMDESAQELHQYKDIVKDSFETIRDNGMLDNANAIRQTGQAVMSIIPYNENLADSWKNIIARIDEANRKMDEQNEKTEQANLARNHYLAMMYRPFPNRSFEDVFYGMRYQRDPETLMDSKVYRPDVYSEVMQNGTDKPKLEINILNDVAARFGMTVEQVKEKISELRVEAAEAARSLQTIGEAMGEASERFGGANISDSATAMENFDAEVEAIVNSAMDGNEKLELLQRKMEIINEQVADRAEALLKKGEDPFDDKQLVNYKLQVISLNEQIEKLASNMRIADMASQMDTLQRDYGADMVEDMQSYSEIDLLRLKLQGLKQALADSIDQNKVDNQQIAAKVMQIMSLSDKIDRLKEAEEEENSVRLNISETTGMAQQVTQLDYLISKVDEAKEKYNELANSTEASSADMAKAAMNINKANLDVEQYTRLQEMLQNVSPEIREFAQDQLNAGVSASTLRSRLFDLDGELKQKKRDFREAGKSSKEFCREIEETTPATNALRGAFDELKEKMKNLGFTKLLKQFARIAKYRMLRSVLKHITEGFSEGVENVYHYSQAIGSAFAPAMDSAASTILQMKNSIGAAVAPLIQALIPYIQQAVNWFINLVNYANQFFALMAGQSTWTRALPATTTAFDKQGKAAKGAAAAVKDLLADWDELNIIQSNTSGAGSGLGSSTAEDFLHMFEEVGKFDNKIQDIVKFIKDNFEMLKSLALAIGAAILGWKLSGGFASVLGDLGSLIGAAATVAVSLILTDAFGKEYINTGDPAWLLADALTGAVGAALAGKIVSKLLGATAGQVTAGFTLVLEGIVNIKNAVSAAEQEQMAESAMLNILGAAEVGIGTAIGAAALGASTAGAIAAGVFTGGLTLVIGVALSLEAKRAASYRKMAIDAFKEAGKNGIDPQEYLKAMQQRLNELTAGSKLVLDVFVGFDESSQNFKANVEGMKSLNALIKSDEALTPEQANQFKEAWGIVFEEMNKLSTIAYDTLKTGLSEALKSTSAEVRQTAKDLLRETVEIEAMTNGAEAAMRKEMDGLLQMMSTSGLSDEEREAAVARYEELYLILAETTESGMEELRTAIANGAKFDFSGEEKPIQAAIDFIANVHGEQIEPAINSAKEAYEAELASLDQVLTNAEKQHKAGYITDEQYENIKQYYDRMKEFHKQQLDATVAEITGMENDAYGTILKGALDGLYGIDTNDEDAIKSYIENVMNPLIKALEDAGYTIPEEVRAAMETAGKRAWASDAQELARKYVKSAVYQSFADNPEIEDAQRHAIAYEIDLAGGNVENITDEAKREIVNAMDEVFGMQPSVFENLHNELGMDYQEILDMLDLSDYTPEELADLQDTIDILNDLYGLDLKLPDIPEEEIKRKTSEAAAAYESMAERIKTALESLSIFGINPLVEKAKLLGIGGVASVPNYTNGGYVRSGDLLMADENGNFEMKGRMGNQPVVANNQQIVDGISRGVSQANGDVVSELRGLYTIMRQLMSKKLIAQAVPGSDWGSHNARSEEAYDRVRG